MSSCSNSPSSVRINQNYDPNNLQKPLTNDTASNNGGKTVAVENADCDLDNAEDADSKPLLNTTENSQIVTNTKRTNRYDKSDEDSAIKAESDNESETLITNNHN